MMSPLGLIKPKAMKNDKGREGDNKFGKMGRCCLWMAPNLVVKNNQKRSYQNGMKRSMEELKT